MRTGQGEEMHPLVPAQPRRGWGSQNGWYWARNSGNMNTTATPISRRAKRTPSSTACSAP